MSDQLLKTFQTSLRVNTGMAASLVYTARLNGNIFSAGDAECCRDGYEALRCKVQLSWIADENKRPRKWLRLRMGTCLTSEGTDWR